MAGEPERIDRIESELVTMKTELAGVVTSTERTESAVNILFDKIDNLAKVTGGNAAIRGMIPVNYVTWGVSALTGLVAVGITMMAMNNKQIAKDIAAGDLLNQRTIELNKEIERLRNEELKHQLRFFTAQK